jgi:hypothetical protein
MRVSERPSIIVKVFLIAFLSSVNLQSAFADDAKLRRLISKSSRPSISDVLTAFGGNVPDANPLGQSGMYSSILTQGPYALVELEGAFPGGTYACLGRDAFFISDVLSAFYINHRLSEDHVYKLHASTATVRALEQSRTLNQFLIHNGLSETNSPYVIIDRTSFREKSQSRVLYNAARNWADGKGLDSKEIAVVSTSHGHTFSQYLHHRLSKSSNYFPLLTNQLQPLIDRGFWTDTFGTQVVSNDNGQLVGVPTSMMSDLSKLEVLKMLVDALIATSRPEFLQSARAHAQSYGFDLMERLKLRAKGNADHSQVAAARRTASSKQADWTLLLGQLAADAQHLEGYFSSNGKLVIQAMDAIAIDQVLEDGFINAIFKGFEEGKLSSKDLRRIVLYAMAMVNTVDEHIKLSKLIRTNTKLSNLLLSRAEVFLTSTRYNGQAEVVYRSLVRDGVLPVAQQCQQLFAQ